MATNAKKIYRGIDPGKEDRTNLKVAGAYLPGTFCSASATTLTQSTSPTQFNYLLGNMEFQGQSVSDAYLSGSTALAYEILPGEDYIARFAAATYTYNQELTIGAAGRLVVAASGNVVVGFYRGSGVALAAGDLDDFTVANSYTKP